MRNLLGSLIVKIGFGLCLMTATIVMAIAISDGVFRKASDSMRDLGEERVPALVAQADALAATTVFQQALSDLLLAPDSGAIDAARTEATAVLDRLSVSARQAGDPGRTEERLATIRELIAQVAVARARDHETELAVAAGVADLEGHIETISGLLTEAEDSAFFELALTSETTIDTVGLTLDSLVENDFSSLRRALQVRSATNDLAGMTLAHGQTADPGLKSILSDLILSSRAELEGLLPELSTRAELATLAGPVTEFLAAIDSAESGRFGRMDVPAILAARAEVDKMVVTAIDEIEFNLFIAAAEAKDGNAATIRSLIEGQVAAIRDGARLASTVRQSVILTLQAIVADEPAQIEVLGNAIRPLAADLGAVAAAAPETPLSAEVTELLALVDPVAGVPALRLASLAARDQAASLAATAAVEAAGIAEEMSRGLDAVLAEVDGSARALMSGLDQARDRLSQVGVLAGVLVLVAVFVTWATVVRPLGRVTRLTERLAGGDLSQVEGMDRWGGELGRMVSALKVFRDGMHERTQLEVEQRRAEAEAQRRARDQAQVVDRLAGAFQRLAEGDLNVKLEADFPEEYAGLRNDFNAAIERLAGLLRAVALLGDRIRASSHEISGTTNDLSTRTEQAAGTLQATVQELAGLAQSVRESAERVTDAAKLGSGARDEAEVGVSVIRKSLEQMNSIAEAFKRISAVIGLIDDIAFQTNLLALNAGVEAARAGDAGRGFAVVASEVRALAQRSSDAARDIKLLIAESDALVATGVQATGQAGQSLSGIVEAVIAMADRIEQIAASSGAQSATIAEVSRAATGLDQNMQYNVARFEETTAASRVLSEEAQVLASRLQDFRLPEATAPMSDRAAGPAMPLGRARAA